MSEVVKMIIEGKTYEFPVIEGSEGEKAFDITKLRQQTGYITMDPGFGNTGSCTSAITFMDGEKGILRYRGIPVEQLAEHSSFVETAYLLINGRLPNKQELTRTSVQLNDDSLIHEDMQIFYQNFPRRAHPMGILSAMINALRSFYPELEDTDPEGINRTFLRLLSKIRTMAAMSYRISRGHKVVYPRADYSYCANFLNMMFHSPVRPYELDPDIVEALNVFWILHADHEQNCSTAAVRVVGSGRVNLYAAISAGIAALWGPLHGGANQAVIEMLTNIHKSGADIEDVVRRAKDKDDPFRLMGFGHRVYKTYDPRARIMKKMCDTVLPKLKVEDPLLDIARRLEEVALTDPYFIDKNLYPNVDFYSGIVLRAMGIPTEMFTVMFAIGRLPGWISQWKEGADDPNWKISRPRQVYTGNIATDYVPINKR
ncbi:citrate synthase [Desulfoluna butyratoxydans]|uniref:Citrate synthase n=1 Tax=Desulfoluna butyratoxydans TaxID=231438 RepID=A0A4U8YNC1_9BACT|nr:citrate synthase [Desulfoluna butyratoxydans]VFQ42703.1 citrate synthase [Desulfoluna butyratoxydans]